jgi:hypothetical protein
MTTKQLERIATELDKLISEHRVVRTEMQSEHMTCVARVDMPEYGIHQGETFHLVACGSHPGYAYIVRWDSDWNKHACTCQRYQFRHQCDDAALVNAICKERYHQQRWDESDTQVHIEDSIASGEMDWSDPFAGMSEQQRREAYRAMYPDDYSYYAA